MYLLRFLNYLVAILLASGALVAQEGKDGWFPVEQPPKPSTSLEGIDPSIWVLFTKSLGEERIRVRLPQDPSYKFSFTGIFEISSQKEGEIFELKAYPQGEIEKRIEEIRSLPEVSLISLESVGEGRANLTYKLNEKWVQESLFQTVHHLYSLQTVGETLEPTNHLSFTRSFDVR